MARKRHPEPFWREARGCWFVQVGKKQIRLSPDRDEAFRLYHELMARPAEEIQVPAKQAALLAVQLVDDFLSWAEANRKPDTLDIYSRLLQKFCESIPKSLAADEVKPFHVTRTMDANSAIWSANTKRNFAVTVQGAFNWAEKQGLIDRSPLRNLTKPARKAREQYVTPADHAKILAAIDSDGFRDLVELAWETGCRPQEVRAIEAKHIDREMNRIVFPPSEAKGGTNHRVVYLATEKAREIAYRLADAQPTGAILRNAKGNAWTRDAINCAFCRVKKKTGAKFHLGAYRKGFVTEALKNGVDTVTLAHLVGHSDAAMISRVYGKVHQDPAHMEEAARRAKGKVKGDGYGGA